VNNDFIEFKLNYFI